MKKLIVLIISMFLLLGCTAPSEKNETINKTKVVEFGSVVEVDYLLYANKTNYSNNKTELILYDTSLPEYANKSYFYSPKRNYGPLVLEVSYNNSFLPGFNRALLGMKKGENKTFYLKPSEAYGLWDPNKTITLNRTYNMSRYDYIPRFYFDMKNISYKINDTLKGKFNATIINITNSTIVVYYTAPVGETIIYNGIPQKIINQTNSSIELEIEGKLGHVYKLIKEDNSIVCRLIKINDTSVVYDYNNILAGKKLKFVVFLNKIIK